MGGGQQASSSPLPRASSLLALQPWGEAGGACRRVSFLMATGTEEDRQPWRAERGGSKGPRRLPGPLVIRPLGLRTGGRQGQGQSDQRLPQLAHIAEAQRHEGHGGEGEQGIGREPGEERLLHTAAVEGWSAGERDAADSCSVHLRVDLPEEIHHDGNPASLVQRSASFARSSGPTSPCISANRNASPAASPIAIGSSTSRGSRCQPASSCPAPVSADIPASVRHGRTPHKSQADPTAERTTDSGSPSTPLCVITNRPPPSTANGVTAATLLSAPGTDASVGVKGSRRSYLTPVRDEEAESLRRARSRQARQARRATQVSVALSESLGDTGECDLSESFAVCFSTGGAVKTQNERLVPGTERDVLSWDLF
ncbi:protein phosphatase 1 regulatory subunit 12A-like [Pteropus vampyrus]|uniref:Protein phosphatase 1 regulatory subunit 12A-like n=1 Tax=Pteropus vampyrus TaxID=132908 RepID=A0A6P6CT16_PTEVA|nr:protein phosphatase 1 regulatory subunit 12A-like [Pteropus vampyrus]